MNSILHVATNAGKWGGESLRLIDARLSSLGSKEIRLRWDDVEMEDSDHFTEEGANVFASRFVDAVVPHVKTRTVLILTDSTVDHNNHSRDGTRHNRASSRITTLFRSHGIHAVVDAICGSGFVARAHAHQHFRSRLASHLAKNTLSPTTVVFMGGWNDVTSPHSLSQILNAITSCVNLATSGPRRIGAVSPSTF